MKFRSFYRVFFLKNIKLFPNALKIALCGSLLLTSLLTQTAKAQAAIEDIEQLRQKVAQFISGEYQQTKATKIDVLVGKHDSRLRLARCEHALVFNLQDTSGSGGNVNVQVNCTAGSRWTILVPAVATVFRPMAIAGRNLQKGDVVGRDDLNTEARDMSQYRQGFLLMADDIVGKEVRYPITKGDAIRTSALGPPLVIKRGDEVTIESAGGAIQVVTNGTALNDGRIGQQIRVKNNQSERIVNAKVIGSGKVQSIL